jgi:hypothetical protein
MEVLDEFLRKIPFGKILSQNMWGFFFAINAQFKREKNKFYFNGLQFNIEPHVKINI